MTPRAPRRPNVRRLTAPLLRAWPLPDPSGGQSTDAQTIARDHARDWGVVLVLKGPTTTIAAPDGRLWVNTAGSAGLGTSGSGDVLAGLIAGLVARGAAPEQAAAWGVHLHARAGARLSRRVGLVGFLAREIGDEIPALMQRL